LRRRIQTGAAKRFAPFAGDPAAISRLAAGRPSGVTRRGAIAFLDQRI